MIGLSPKIKYMGDKKQKKKLNKDFLKKQ